MDEEARLQGLFARYVEHHVEHGTAIPTEELWREDPELRVPLQQLIRDYHQLDRSLAPPSSLEIGEQVDSYRIDARLGSGGMGEVYKATDQKLGRTVAIKVLHPEMASDRERLQRFEQEARSASAFNHPNIITIYDIDWHDGAPFIATEYVEGSTLTDLMAEGRLSIRKALDYSVQIADGLARAHAQGLVHRDLKPDNVMITTEGLVKILDFGLAKLARPDDWTEGTTQDLEHPQTQEGHILGTAPYMSPEQAQGQDLDFRSDIFSFGSLLYEMVTGRRPFSGDSAIKLLAAIVEKEPESAGDLQPTIPPELNRILQRAMQKEPERRFQSTADLKLELQEIKENLESGTAIPSGRLGAVSSAPRRRAWHWILGLLTVLGIGLGIWYGLTAFEPDRPPARTLPLTSLEGREYGPALSPDGRQVVFSWDEGVRSAPYQLYLKLVDVGEPLRLTDGPTSSLRPAWSADGTRIAFLRTTESDEDQILEISALGGAEQMLATTKARTGSVSWSPDGTHLAIVDKTSPETPDAIFLLSRETGEKSQLTEPPDELSTNAGDRAPAFSPDGGDIAFVRQRQYIGASDLYLVAVETGKETRLTFDDAEISDVDWSPDGRALVFASKQEGLWALWRVSRSGGEATRLPFGQGASQLSVSRSGHRLAYTEVLSAANIWRAPGPAAAEPSAPTRIIGSSRRDLDAQYSPDGNRILFASTRSGRPENWICDSEGQGCELLVAGFNPAWSPDGKFVVYCSDFDEGGSNLYIIDARGGFARRLTQGSEDYMPSWSRDGEWIYFLSPRRTGLTNIWKIRPDGEDLQQVTEEGGGIPLESPDGRYLYFVDPEPNTERRCPIWRMPIEGGERTLVLDRRPDYMNWDLWEDSIVFLDEQTEGGPTIEVFDVATGQTRVLAGLGPEARPSKGLSVSPDGRWVAFSQRDIHLSDLKLVENFYLDRR